MNRTTASAPDTTSATVPSTSAGTRNRRAQRTLAALSLASLLALTLGACSSDDGPGVASADGGSSNSADPSPTESVSDEDAMREFAACMREHGVDMDDSGVVADAGENTHEQGAATLRENEDGTSSFETGEPDPAMEACSQYLPNGGEPVEMTEAEKQAMLDYAACMRENGVDMPDPDFESGMMASGRGMADDETFEAAAEICNEFDEALTGGGE